MLMTTGDKKIWIILSTYKSLLHFTENATITALIGFRLEMSLKVYIRLSDPASYEIFAGEYFPPFFTGEQ